MFKYLAFLVACVAAYCFGDLSVMAQQPVFTGGGADEGLAQLQDNLGGTGVIQSDDIVVVILGWVRFGLALLGLVAFVAFLWAGALYITAFANEENAETAKKVMVWTAMGIIVILMSYVLVGVLIDAQI